MDFPLSSVGLCSSVISGNSMQRNNADPARENSDPRTRYRRSFDVGGGYEANELALILGQYILAVLCALNTVRRAPAYASQSLGRLTALKIDHRYSLNSILRKSR